MRYDKRGTRKIWRRIGQRQPLPNSKTTIPLLASDMTTVLDQLLADPRIDPARIGLFGSSQANWYMPVVAKERPEVDFLSSSSPVACFPSECRTSTSK